MARPSKNFPPGSSADFPLHFWAVFGSWFFVVLAEIGDFHNEQRESSSYKIGSIFSLVTSRSDHHFD